jgi:hypothetical protein
MSQIAFLVAAHVLLRHNIKSPWGWGFIVGLLIIPIVERFI